MPALVALAARAIIQSAVTLGLLALVDNYLLPLVNKTLEKIMVTLGVSEEDAKDIMANEIIQFAESVGILALTLRTKLPTKIAERLGFTSKGFAKRTLSTKALAAVGRKTESGIILLSEVPTPTATQADTILKTAKTTLKGAGVALSFLEKRLNTIFLGFLVGVNMIDFGNWETGAYAKTFQRIFEKISFGLLKPDEDWRKTKTTSPEVFDKVYNTYKLSGATGINDPFKRQSVLFTRDNLIDLIDRVGAELLRTTQRASTKDVLLATQVYIVLNEVLTAPTETAGIKPVARVGAVKPFSGSLSQQTIGQAVPFEVRPDDLIENMEELRAAIINNEAPFIASLGGMLVREVKIVPTVTTKEGIIKRGTAQRVISGQKADGTTTYRIITNKFAVADIYILTEKGTRTKIRRIIYGPVNSATFKPDQEKIDRLQTELQQRFAATGPGLIQQIIQPAENTVPVAGTGDTIPSAATVPPPVIKVNIIPRAYFVEFDQFYQQVFYREGNHLVASPLFTNILTEDEKRKLPNVGAQNAEAIRRLIAVGYPLDTYPHQKFHHEIDGRYVEETRTASFEEFFGTTISARQSPEEKKLPDAALQAQTLYEFYQAQGLSIPSISLRGKIYEELGLGQAAYYTGTSEQNIKLLAKLQGKA